jgi:hypothetical protein
MPSPRPAGSIHKLLFDVLHELDDDEIESATGNKRDTIMKKSNHLISAGPTFDEAAGLDGMLVAKGQPSVFLEFFRQTVEKRQQEFSNQPRQKFEELTTKVLHLNIQVGKLSEEVDNARKRESPGGKRITTTEWRKLLDAAENVRRVASHIMEVARVKAGRS